jgi:glycosyltransferase involved in cell wall biosynthesis
MIVKDEAHCITKCLNSIKPFIDYWVICDTGSTDNTEQVVKDCLHDIPGEFHKHQWSDFATNRNLSLQLAKLKADYVLIIDADDFLVVNDINAFKNLKEQTYQIEINRGSIVYNRIQLFNSKIPVGYVGVLHEYLEIPENIKPVLLQNCKIIFGATGARSKNPQKYLNDAKIFEKALIADPNNARYVFYGAQSYRDASMKEESLKLYIQHSKMGGWIEEQYVSLLEAAKIIESLSNDINTIENAYLAAYNRHPARIESLCYLSAFCRKQKLFDKAYFYSKIGYNIIKNNEMIKPVNALFLEFACYDWKIIDELAVAAYWIGKKQEAAYLNNLLLNNNLLPKNEITRIISNLKFCEI